MDYKINSKINPNNHKYNLQRMRNLIYKIKVMNWMNIKEKKINRLYKL